LSAPGEKPAGFEEDLGPYEPVMFGDDGSEPFAWGHRLLTRLGPDRWAALGEQGRLQCFGSILSPRWFLITRLLSPAEAAEKWGPPSVELGPRGGFRSVSYGGKKFSSRDMDPRVARA
jgi:hypothetical protein